VDGRSHVIIVLMERSFPQDGRATQIKIGRVDALSLLKGPIGQEGWIAGRLHAIVEESKRDEVPGEPVFASSMLGV
jgi:hypothetical protein